MNFEEKYRKYKNKYLQLKKIQQGGLTNILDTDLKKDLFYIIFDENDNFVNIGKFLNYNTLERNKRAQEMGIKPHLVFIYSNNTCCLRLDKPTKDIPTKYKFYLLSEYYKVKPDEYEKYTRIIKLKESTSLINGKQYIIYNNNMDDIFKGKLHTFLYSEKNLYTFDLNDNIVSFDKNDYKFVEINENKLIPNNRYIILDEKDNDVNYLGTSFFISNDGDNYTFNVDGKKINYNKNKFKFLTVDEYTKFVMNSLED